MMTAVNKPFSIEKLEKLSLEGSFLTCKIQLEPK
jgi:hypothetical protein